MKAVKKMTVALLIAVMAAAMAACGGSSSKNALPGTWNAADESTGTKYTFNEDGTGSVTVGTGITLSLTYTIEDNKIAIVMSYLGTEQKDEYTYEIKDKKLTLTNSSGAAVYNKQ